MYYAERLYSSQLSAGDEYPELRPTIVICLLSAMMFPKISVGHLKFSLSDLQYELELTDHFQIHTVELPKYNVHVSNCPIGVCLEKWAWLFQRAVELDAAELRSLLPEPAFQKMLGILELISKTQVQRHIYESQ